MAVKSVIFLIFMIYIEGNAFLGTIVTVLLLRFQDNVALMRERKILKFPISLLNNTLISAVPGMTQL